MRASFSKRPSAPWNQTFIPAGPVKRIWMRGRSSGTNCEQALPARNSRVRAPAARDHCENTCRVAGFMVALLGNRR